MPGPEMFGGISRVGISLVLVAVNAACAVIHVTALTGG
jgi:hypothetical protein